MTEINNQPVTIVIFGASGDLTHRKLIPSLYHNFQKNRLPSGTKIVGFARRDWNDATFRDKLKDGVQRFSHSFNQTDWDAFAPSLTYLKGDLDTAEDYHRLREYLLKMETAPTNRLYYLATAPRFYASAAHHLGGAGLANQNFGWRNIIVEKPFGHDLESAETLNKRLHAIFQESQIYRIDHYLGKETAQNILFLRFANTIFEPIWNRRYVDHVQITVAEDVDVGHRGGYYDQAGVMRDMFQNHLLQLLSLVAMEPPASLDADAIRNEKVKLLQSVRPIPLSDTVRAQYDGYRNAPGVAADSQTPTYAALKVFIDNWRWKGVPFYLRSGKALPAKTSEIAIQFQAPPDIMFNLDTNDGFEPNTLSICIQPDEGIHLKFETKVPDSVRESRSVDMEFHYRDSFNDKVMPDAYERLLLDALKADASLFARSDGIHRAWELIDPIITGWATSPDAPPLARYDSGSWGPAEAHELLAQMNHKWRLGCGGH